MLDERAKNYGSGWRGTWQDFIKAERQRLIAEEAADECRCVLPDQWCPVCVKAAGHGSNEIPF